MKRIPGQSLCFPAVLANGSIAGIEVKGRDAVTSKDFNGLKVLQQQSGKDFICGIILYRGKKIVPFAKDLWAVPVEAMWA